MTGVRNRERGATEQLTPAGRSLLVLYAVALGVRVAFLVALYALPAFFDPSEITDGWDRVARNLLEHGMLAWSPDPTSPTMTRTPVYPAFLTGLMLATGGNLLLVRILYLAADAALAVLVVLLAVRVACSRAEALAAGYLYAVCLLPAWHIAKLSPDAFLGLVLTTALLLFLRHVYDAGRHGVRRTMVVVSGLALGIALLTKKTILLVAPLWIVVAVAGSRFRRRTLVAAVAYLLAAAVVVAPWLYRNYRLAGRPAPIQTLAWTVYWYGDFVDANVDSLGTDSFYQRAFDYVAGLAGDGLRRPAYELTVAQDLAREERLRRLAMRQIREHPGRVAAKSARNIVRYWYLTETGRLTRYTKVAGAALFVLFATGVALLARRRRLDGAAVLLAVTVLCFNVSYAAFFSILRYLVPVTPLVCVFAGVGVGAGFRILHSRARRRTG
jgi:4-amino-4-deoxy-L-arabinose transferase-like glycosyltransferase